MSPSAPRRPQAPSRTLGALLALILLAGQTALLAHHHEPRPAGGARPAFSRAGDTGADAGCRLCSLSMRTRASHVAAAAPAVPAPVVRPAPAPASIAPTGRIAAFRASSRAPPLA